MQLLLVYILIALAAGYAVWRTVRALRRAGDPCAGCDGCALKEAARKAKKKKCEKK